MFVYRRAELQDELGATKYEKTHKQQRKNFSNSDASRNELLRKLLRKKVKSHESFISHAFINYLIGHVILCKSLIHNFYSSLVHRCMRDACKFHRRIFVII